MARRKKPVVWSKLKGKGLARARESAQIESLQREHQERIAKLDAELARVRDECGQEYEQIKAKLDQALEREKRAAVELREAAAHRVKVAREERHAKLAHKRRACKTDVDAVRKRKRLEDKNAREMRQLEAQTARRELAIEKERSKSSASERRKESRGEVRGNLEHQAPHLLPLWDKVGKSFKVGKKASRFAGGGAQREGISLMEAFVEWAAENPTALARAQEEALQKGAREHEREERKRLAAERKRERASRGGKRSKRAPVDLSDVPF
jgi:ElaB/YqjD/DUF883 family membrane-anchored ribosome-binding protein